MDSVFFAMQSVVSPPDPANLIVNYIPTPVGDAELAQLFAPFGQMQLARIIRDKVTGSHRGFGFVKYASATAAITAIQHMNGFSIHGKRLKVSYALGSGAQDLQPTAAPVAPHVGPPIFVPRPARSAITYATPTPTGGQQVMLVAPVPTATPRPQVYELVPTAGGLAWVPATMPVNFASAMPSPLPLPQPLPPATPSTAPPTEELLKFLTAGLPLATEECASSSSGSTLVHAATLATPRLEMEKPAAGAAMSTLRPAWAGNWAPC